MSLIRCRRMIAVAAGVVAFAVLTAAPIFVDATLLGNVALWVGTLASLGNVIGYSLWARWWESEYGWNIMYFNLSLGAIFGYALARVIANTQPLQQDHSVAVARYVIFGAVAFGMAWRLWILIRKQILDPYRIRMEEKRNDREGR